MVAMNGIYYSNLDSPKKYMFMNNTKMIMSMVMFIVFVNFWALLPYVYGVSTKIAFGLTFGLCVWLLLQLSSAEMNMKSYVSHFVSLGSPLGLGFPLVFVDILSSLVRPLTLALRLVMNMSIGHVIFSLMGLVGAKMIFSNFVVSFMLLGVLFFFFLVECCVSMIQSLVFGLLIVNYLGEHS